MAEYKEVWPNPNDPTVTGYQQTTTGKCIPLDPGNADYQNYLQWEAGGGVADPAYTQAEIDAFNLEVTQAGRRQQLRNALIDQFKMILALFQVGKAKGIWVNDDFDADLRAKAAQWIAIIADYEADS
jgi:hypothetical protein